MTIAASAERVPGNAEEEVNRRIQAEIERSVRWHATRPEHIARRLCERIDRVSRGAVRDRRSTETRRQVPTTCVPFADRNRDPPHVSPTRLARNFRLP